MTRILVITRSKAPVPTDPEAEIVLRTPEGLPAEFEGPAHWPLVDLAYLAAGQGAASDGFDAVCVGDVEDFGANALRSVLNMPVIGAGRSAMLYALTLGARFGVIVQPGLACRMKKQVQEFGLSAQCAGIVSAPSDGDLGQAAGQVPDADVLILAGEFGDADAQALRDDTGLPVVSPLPLSIKLAMGFLALGLGHSERSYPAPEVPKPEMIAALAAPASN